MMPVMKAISFLLLAHQAVALHDEYKVSVVVGCKEEEEAYVTKNESGLKFFLLSTDVTKHTRSRSFYPLTDKLLPQPHPERTSLSHTEID
jgi:hypothetical protein